jgi:predicted DNA-binding transcriptional regulator AlpA
MKEPNDPQQNVLALFQHRLTEAMKVVSNLQSDSCENLEAKILEISRSVAAELIKAKLSLESLRMVTLKEVQAITGYSRSMLNAMMNKKSPYHDPTMPKRLGSERHSIRFIEAEIIQWILSMKNRGV